MFYYTGQIWFSEVFWLHIFAKCTAGMSQTLMHFLYLFETFDAYESQLSIIYYPESFDADILYRIYDSHVLRF